MVWEIGLSDRPNSRGSAAGLRHRGHLAALHGTGPFGTYRGIRVLRVVRRVVAVVPGTLEAMRLGRARRVLEPEIPVLPLGGLAMEVVGEILIRAPYAVSHPPVPRQDIRAGRNLRHEEVDVLQVIGS